MRRLVVLVVLILAAGCMPSLDRGSDAKSVAEELPKVPVIVVLDASGSMKVEDAPGQRFAAAQDAVRSLVKVLSGEHEIGLTVYGTSTGSSDEEEAAGCQDIKQVVPFSPLDKKAFTAAVDGLKPSGYTPIGAALTDAAGQLPSSGKRAIVLVSDGVDTCAPPDPCDVAEDLHDKDPDLVVHTVAFRVADDPAAREQLSCIADAGGGLDLDASSGALLSTRLLAVFDPARAANSLQPGGYRGLQPGMPADQARKAAPKLPKIDPEGRVEIVYVDCTLVFEDGVLVEIRPKGKNVKTLDGIGIGDDIAEAEKIYAEPGGVTDRTKNTVTYPADSRAGTGYRITFEPDGHSGKIAGPITRIILCRCRPGGGSELTLRPPSYMAGQFGESSTVYAGGGSYELGDEEYLETWLPGGRVVVASYDSLRVIDVPSGKVVATADGLEWGGWSAYGNGRLASVDLVDDGYGGYDDVLTELDEHLEVVRRVTLPEIEGQWVTPAVGDDGVTFVEISSGSQGPNHLARVDGDDITILDIDADWLRRSADGSVLLVVTQDDRVLELDPGSGAVVDEHAIDVLAGDSCLVDIDKARGVLAVRTLPEVDYCGGDFWPESQEYQTFELRSGRWVSVGRGDFLWQSSTVKIEAPRDFGTNLDNEEPVSSDYPKYTITAVRDGHRDDLGRFQFISFPGFIVRP